MQEDIVKNQIGIVNSIWYFIIIFGAVLIFTAPFWHIDFPKETIYIAKLKERLQKTEESMVSDLDNLFLSYQKGNITAANYIAQNIHLSNQLENLKKTNKEHLANEMSERKIFDWETPRIFLIGFGIRLPYIVFSLIISILIALRKDTSKKLRIAFGFLQVSCWSISTYLIIWVFWYSDDYPLDVYRYAFILTSILIGTAISLFIANYQSTSSILKSKIRYIMNLMIDQAVDKGHIKDQDRYEDEIIFPALKKLDE